MLFYWIKKSYAYNKFGHLTELSLYGIQSYSLNFYHLQLEILLCCREEEELLK